jgi:methionine aminotransferase
LPNTGTSIFAVMSALAKEHGAINLAQGFPDFEVSPKLVSLVHKYMKEHHNQYAPMPGIMPLRETIAQKTQELYGPLYNPETEITITPGGTLALYSVITAMVKPGDDVIVIEPAYDSYIPAIELNGGQTVRVEMKYPDYKIDWEEVKKLISYKTRMIIINTPHNPTGGALTREGLAALQKLVENTDIVILSDEVYEHILFDGLEHQSMARYPKLAERSFIVSSFGKTYHCTGWKMGYVLAPANLTEQLRRVYQFMAFSANTPMQYAFNDMLQTRDSYLSVAKFYQEKRDYFQKLLRGSKFEVLNCSGSYFQLLGYKQISDDHDVDFARQLTIEHKIATIPVSVFYRMKRDDKVLRLCFAKENKTLEQAAETLCSI